MKSYLSLILISARVHRKQNNMTLICIIMSVFLVTAIFSMSEVWFKGETQGMIKRHGSHHIILHDISEMEAQQIAQRDVVSASAWYGELNEDLSKEYTVSGQKAVICGTEQSYITDIRSYPVEGAYPQNDGEVMLSGKTKELLSVNVGDSIVLNTPSGDHVYTVSGFCNDYDFNNFSGIGVYMDRLRWRDICAGCGEETSASYYIRFEEKIPVREAIEDIRAQSGLMDINIEENMITMGASGYSSDERIKNIYGLAAALFLLILMAGILMISSCMNSNIAQRTQFFGMMRCIGASRKQIIHFVRLEALNWCRTAIPIGCGLGVFLSWILCLVLSNLVKGEFTEFTFRFSIIGIVSGIVVGVVTVLLAAHSPARRAARVSPVTAVSGNAGESEKISHAADTRLFKVETALGVNHAVMSRKNLVLMTLSFALTIILFFAFYGFLNFAKKLLPSMSNFSPDISIVSKDTENSMKEDLVEEIRAVPGVENAFGTAFAYDTLAEINGRAESIDLISYDEYLLDSAQKSVVSGSIDKVYGDSDYAFVIFTQDSRLDTGDRIRIGDSELEVAGVVSEGVGARSQASVCCSEETFRRITGEKDYMLINAILSEDATEETVDEIRILTGENEMADRREEDKQMHNSYWVVRIMGYGFLTIIALITIFNIMNSISMSVSARIRQYGAMRAVGMSVRQLTWMIAAEALTYAVSGLVLGGIFGMLLHRYICVKLIYEHFGGTWSVPAEPIVIVLVIIVVSCVAAVYTPYKRIRDLSITDTIQAQ